MRLVRTTLSGVGEGGLIWDETDLEITIQARRWLRDDELRLLPQHKLPEHWTAEDERRARAGEGDA